MELGIQPARLPALPNATVGRARDIDAVAELLRREEVRLVTLIGPGGVGKTRLAIEIARAVGERFPDGPGFVALDGTADIEHALPALAGALGAQLEHGEALAESLARFLGLRPALLVVDNLEHLLEAGPWLGEAIATCPGLQLIVTSREPLQIRAEYCYRVDPLSPESAASLLIDRARAGDSGFEPEAGAIAEVCARLDGLPLAIELAAARLALLPVADLARRLGSNVHAVGAGPRDLPGRHRTLTATINWSFDLLEPVEQDAFVAFSVFAGSPTPETAEEVAGATLQTLESLTVKSLLSRRGSRLGMLDTIRQFGRERLDAGPDGRRIRARHLDHFVALAERSEPEADGRAWPATVERLDAEIDDLRAAMDWALGHGEAERALRLAAALSPYWYGARFVEGMAWLDRALAAAADADPLVRAKGHHARAALGRAVLEFEQTERDAQAGLELYRAAGNGRGIAACLGLLAANATAQGRLERANTLADEAIAAGRDADALPEVAMALRWKARSAGSYAEARPFAEEAAALFRTAGNLRALTLTLSMMGWIAIEEEQYDGASDVLRDALAAAEELGEPMPTAQVRGNQGLVALLCGEYGKAARAFRDEVSGGADLPFTLGEGLMGLGALAAHQGELERAAKLRGASFACGYKPWGPDAVVDRRIEQRFFEPARRTFGETAWASAEAYGGRLGFADAIAVALADEPPVSVAGSAGGSNDVLHSPLARAGLAELFRDLRTMRGGALQEALARTLGDPALVVAFRRLEEDGYVDGNGARVVLPSAGGDRAVASVERDGREVAALVYDAALDKDPELVEAICAAAALVLENEHLHLESQARLAELQASRQRIVAAGDAERRRLERNLHDGAQQRLVALALQLRVIQAGIRRDPSSADALIDTASEQLAQSLEELRELARGIHPAVLEHGLDSALKALAGRSTVPTAVFCDAPERLSQEVELALYFVACEALANVSKYAHASTASVRLSRAPAGVAIEIADDGVGGANEAVGTGLRGLADRVEALGGSLLVTSPDGAGTVVIAELPFES